MQVFFSWSGASSKAAAEALATFTSQVIQAVEPWLSQAIAKGARWREELNLNLEKSRFGVSCLTRENLGAQWLLFEAGAMSKTKDAQLCTFLLDLSPADVSGPLSAFQHTLLERSDLKRLIETVNSEVRAIGEKALSESALDKAFDLHWPELERSLGKAKSAAPPPSRPGRSDRELLEEILEHVRRPARDDSYLRSIFEGQDGKRLEDKLRAIQYQARDNAKGSDVVIEKLLTAWAAHRSKEDGPSNQEEPQGERE